MHLPSGSARRGSVHARAWASLFGLAGLLAATSWLAPRVLDSALEREQRDRSRAGVRPLEMRAVAWSLALPEGCSGSLRARVMRLAPRRAGPFALNAVRRPVLEDVDLELRDASGSAWHVRAPRAAWDGSALAMEGGCTVAGAAGIEHATRVFWRRGTDRLEVEHDRRAHGPHSIAEAAVDRSRNLPRTRPPGQPLSPVGELR